MNRPRKWYTWWKNLAPIPFILFTAILSELLTLPITYAFERSGLSDEEIGYPDIEKYSLFALVASVVIVAPVLETLMGQSLPFYLVRKWVRWRPRIVAVIASTLLFSFFHAVYSYWYAMAIIPSGLLLAMTFMVFQSRRESAFWMTAAAHAVMNLLAVTPLLLDKLM